MKPIKITTDIYCASCNTLLRTDEDIVEADIEVRVTVVPCHRCQDIAREQGYAEGCEDMRERYTS